MADIETRIETLEHQWMRAWIDRDRKALRRLTGKPFRMIVAGKKSVLLDRASLVDAPAHHFACEGYRFGSVYVRRHDRTAVFKTSAELAMKLEGRPWTGSFWLEDLWLRSRARRHWHLVERSLSRLDEDERVPGSIRALQLWR